MDNMRTYKVQSFFDVGDRSYEKPSVLDSSDRDEDSHLRMGNDDDTQFPNAVVFSKNCFRAINQPSSDVPPNNQVYMYNYEEDPAWNNYQCIYCGRINQIDIEYSVTLSLVDIQSNTNSYYLIRLLKSKTCKRYCVFESWGRIGTVIGSNQVTWFTRKEEAEEWLHVVYKEKTGNKFNHDHFDKLPNRFCLLDIDSELVERGSISLIETRLLDPVYRLMGILFDIHTIDTMIMNCNLNLKLMPLGKISERQIQLARAVLTEIWLLIEDNATFDQLCDASNRFYTLIPHDFGVERPLVIDSLKVVKAENEMLQNLSNMKMICGTPNEEYNEQINPLDACYQQLNADIIPLDKTSQEFGQLCNMIYNTHGPTHNDYAIEVLEIFSVNRRETAKQSQAFQNIGNHVLLWHGSRLANFVGILTNGLKVAPSEALASGSMFGNGIYFADISSKSANFCYTDRINNIGLMLLCEVALGDKLQLGEGDYELRDMPNTEYQSVEVAGSYRPLDWRYSHGVTAPYDAVELLDNLPLLYNEYVVYDPAQVRIRYLFQMKFNYKE